MLLLLSCDLESGRIVIEILNTLPCTHWVFSRYVLGLFCDKKNCALKNDAIEKHGEKTTTPCRTWMWLWCGCIRKLSALLNLFSMFLFCRRQGKNSPGLAQGGCRKGHDHRVCSSLYQKLLSVAR